jgi:hypothetical protein
MVVADFDIMGVAICETKADAPLIVDPNGELTVAISPQPFQLIAGRDTQIINDLRRIQGRQLPFCSFKNIARQPFGPSRQKEPFRLLILERPYHEPRSQIKDAASYSAAASFFSRLARSLAKSSPAWCEERVSGEDETIRKPLE